MIRTHLTTPTYLRLIPSIFRAKERAIFEDVTFHLSPSVKPSLDALRLLIEAGGGTVEEEIPSLKKLAEHIRVSSFKTHICVIPNLVRQDISNSNERSGRH
jgi:hypothetical protein